jgi:hypothetical protein
MLISNASILVITSCSETMAQHCGNCSAYSSPVRCHKRPSILLLDEGTSHPDLNAEARINANLRARPSPIHNWGGGPRYPTWS